MNLARIMNWIRALKGTLDGCTIGVSITLPTFGRKKGFVPHNFNVKPKGFKPQWVVIHHSATKDSGTKNWDAIRKFHVEVRGWSTIGYTYGVENVDGKLTILEGRPIGEVGAHAIGFNANSIGICLVGNYDIESPSEDRLSLLEHLIRDIQREFRIPRENVLGHFETYSKRSVPVEKSCPGIQFDMALFRKRLLDV